MSAPMRRFSILLKLMAALALALSVASMIPSVQAQTDGDLTEMREASNSCYRIGYDDGTFAARRLVLGRHGTVGRSGGANFCRRLGVLPSQSYSQGYTNGMLDVQSTQSRATNRAAESDSGCIEVPGPGGITRCYR